jgi:hypothetical protein
MKIRFTSQYLIAYVCLGMILGISHELSHHVAGYLICGDWGYKTFNSFRLAEGCSASHPQTAWLATLTGPVLFNYIPMWIGYFKLKQPDEGTKLFGFTLIFSSIPVMRIVFNLVGANDEAAIVRMFFGENQLAFWLMNAVIWLIAFPPLILAYRSIRNAKPALLFLLNLLAFPVFVFFFVGIFLEDLIIKHHVLAETIWGMPYLVILVEILAYAGYQLFKKHVVTAVPVEMGR